MTDLTGRRRYRAQKRLFREPLLVLQVEETIHFGAIHDDFHPMASSDAATFNVWRDARVEDVVK